VRPSKRTGSREQALAAQRLRLIGAMIGAVEEKGYRTATVADVIALAGVSRKTFYNHFANKRACFLAAYDLISERAVGRLTRAYGEAEGWPDRVEAAIRALFEAAIENPGALRVALLEIGAVGPAGFERRERSIAGYEGFILDATKLAPGRGTMSETNLRTVVGGLMRVLTRRVLHGDRDELLALVPDLVTWATSYYPTPARIAKPRPVARVDLQRRLALKGGRAPGTLAPHGPLTPRRGLPRGDQNVSRSFVVHSQRERILDAVANLTAAQGYAALKVEDVAEHAAVSLNAFYEHFADKEDALLVAYEVGHAKALAIVEHAYTSETDWRLAVHAGIGALFEFLAAEPSFAHIALVDALIATPHTAERSNVGVDAFARMLVPGMEEIQGQNPLPLVTIEAITGGLFELCLYYSLQRRIHELPELTPAATYFALRPFLGSEEATRVAAGKAKR
jgi:AcrR family transcriptional regulator